MYQGVGGFKHSAGFLDRNFSSSVECLKAAEEAIKEAGERCYKDYSPLLRDDITKILELVTVNFRGSHALLKYLEGSEFNFNEYQEAIREVIPSLAQDYARQILKRTRRIAKSLRRTYKIKKDMAGRLRRNLEDVEKLGEYGVQDTERMNEIRLIAWDRGVVYIVNKADELAPNESDRAQRFIEVAKRNARELGADIS